MRVLYIQPAERFGGAERQGLVAARYLREQHDTRVTLVVGPGRTICRLLDQQGLDDYIYCSRIPAQPDRSLGLANALPTMVGALGDWQAAYTQLLPQVGRIAPEVIVGSRPAGWALASALGRRVGVPVVWRAGTRAHGWRQHAGLRLLRTMAPDLLVCNSRGVEQTIAPRLTCRSVVSPNGVDLERFDPRRCSADALRDRFGIGARPVIGVVARPTAGKGFAPLAVAAEQLSRRRPDVRVLVAGESSWREHWEARYQREGLASTVLFLGQVDDMPAFYRACDIVVLMSCEAEGSPNALLEAMAMRVPVIATRVGGITELVSEREGVLVEPDQPRQLVDEALALLDDGARRLRMGRAGRAKIERSFSARAMAARLYQLLAWCVADGVGGGGDRPRRAQSPPPPTQLTAPWS